jgi:hypothetical protein
MTGSAQSAAMGNDSVEDALENPYESELPDSPGALHATHSWMSLTNGHDANSPSDDEDSSSNNSNSTSSPMIDDANDYPGLGSDAMNARLNEFSPSGDQQSELQFEELQSEELQSDQSEQSEPENQQQRPRTRSTVDSNAFHPAADSNSIEPNGSRKKKFVLLGQLHFQPGTTTATADSMRLSHVVPAIEIKPLDVVYFSSEEHVVVTVGQRGTVTPRLFITLYDILKKQIVETTPSHIEAKEANGRKASKAERDAIELLLKAAGNAESNKAPPSPRKRPQKQRKSGSLKENTPTSGTADKSTDKPQTRSAKLNKERDNLMAAIQPQIAQAVSSALQQRLA